MQQIYFAVSKNFSNNVLFEMVNYLSKFSDITFKDELYNVYCYYTNTGFIKKFKKAAKQLYEII